MANLRVHSVFDWSVMKKLTFIEALQANESKLVGICGSLNRYPVGELKDSSRSLCDLFNCDFYTEPEKFEFECDWYMSAEVIYPVGNKVITNLVGKRTKVTVEVIDE